MKLDSNKEPQVKRDILKGLLIYLLVTTVIFFDAFLSGRLPYPFDQDFLLWDLPYLANIYEKISSNNGNWFHFLFCGIPSLNRLFSFIFNPLYLLSPFMSFTTGVAVIIFIYLVLAAFFMFVFLRRLAAFDFWPSILGGAVYLCLPFSTWLTFAQNFSYFLPAYTFFPLLALIFLHSLETSWPNSALFGFVLSIVILISFQPHIIGLSLIFFYLCLSFAIIAAKDNKFHPKQLLFKAGIIITVVLIILGPYYYYFLQESQASLRWQSQLYLMALSSLVKSILFFISRLLPNYNATSIFPLFVLFSVAAVVTLILGRESRQRIAAGGTGSKARILLLFTLFICLNSLFFQGTMNVPYLKSLGYGLFIVPPLSLNFCLAFVSAFGFNYLWNGLSGDKLNQSFKFTLISTGVLYMVFAAITVAALAGWKIWHLTLLKSLTGFLEPQFDKYFTGSYRIVFILFLLIQATFLLAAWYGMQKGKTALARICLPCLIIISVIPSRWAASRPFFPLRHFYEDVGNYRESLIMKKLSPADRVYVDSGLLSNYIRSDRKDNFLLGNFPMRYGVNITSGMLPLFPDRLSNFLQFIETGHLYSEQSELKRAYHLEKAFDTPRMKLLDMLGINWLFSLKELSPRDKLEALGKGNIYYIYRNENALPKCLLIGEGVIRDNPGEIFTTIMEPEFDPARKCIVEEEEALKGVSSLGQSQLDLQEYSADYLRTHVQLDSPKLLLTTDSYHRFWHAYIDNREVPIYRLNFYCRGVRVPAGNHKVEMKFILPGWLKMYSWLK